MMINEEHLRAQHKPITIRGMSIQVCDFCFKNRIPGSKTIPCSFIQTLDLMTDQGEILMAEMDVEVSSDSDFVYFEKVFMSKEDGWAHLKAERQS